MEGGSIYLLTDHGTSTCQLIVDLRKTILAALITRLIRQLEKQN